MRMRLMLVVLAAILLVACGEATEETATAPTGADTAAEVTATTAAPEPSTAPTDEPKPTATSEPTSTPEPTATATLTPTPEPTNTPAPTATPEPTSTPTPEPTATPEGMDPVAEAAYSTWAVDVATRYGAAWEAMVALFDRPDALVGAQWNVDVALAAGTVLALTDEVIQYTGVPPRMGDIHAHFVAASNYYEQSILTMLEGFDTLDADKIDEATVLLQAGTAEIQEATRLTEALTATTH